MLKLERIAKYYSSDDQIIDLRMPDYLRFFTFSDYLVAFTLLMGLAYFLGRRFNRKMFTRSVQDVFRES